jgi:hypothetical protein
MTGQATEKLSTAVLYLALKQTTAGNFGSLINGAGTPLQKDILGG